LKGVCRILKIIQEKLSEARALIEYKPQIVVEEGEITGRYKTPDIHSSDKIAKASVALQTVSESRDLAHPMKDHFLIEHLYPNDIPLPTDTNNPLPRSKCVKKW
jgi:hypothetical protein